MLEKHQISIQYSIHRDVSTQINKTSVEATLTLNFTTVILHIYTQLFSRQTKNSIVVLVSGRTGCCINRE